MSDTSDGPGWWQASDGKWYPPDATSADPPSTGTGQVAIGPAFSFAWMRFTATPGPLVVATLLPWVAHAVLNVGVGVGITSILLRSLWSLLVTAVVAVLTMGLAQMSLKLARGEAIEMGDALPKGPMVIAYAVTAVVAEFVLGIGFALCIIPGLLLAPLLVFAHFVVLDEGLAPGDALARSLQLGRSAYGPVLGFLLVAFLVNLLGVLACFVGLVLTVPVTSVAAAHVYKSLKGSPIPT